MLLLLLHSNLFLKNSSWTGCLHHPLPVVAIESIPYIYRRTSFSYRATPSSSLSDCSFSIAPEKKKCRRNLPVLSICLKPLHANKINHVGGKTDWEFSYCHQMKSVWTSCCEAVVESFRPAT